jgi:DNA-directed RNA polymerase specialized sigma24 family protein
MNLEDEQLKAALATLLPRERRILEMRGNGQTFEQIAAAFGFSRAQAHRLAATAKRKLEARLKSAARADKWRNVLAGGTALDTNQADGEQTQAPGIFEK